MAKKKVAKKTEKKDTVQESLATLTKLTGALAKFNKATFGRQGEQDERMTKIEQRIDRIVAALDRSRSVRGL